MQGFISSLSRLQKIAWVVTLAISVVTFLSIWYSDLGITYRHGMSLIDCLLNGQLVHFYPLAEQQVGDMAAYCISVYVIFAVWNIPTWIMTRFFGVPEDAVGCLLWAKAMLVVFLLLALLFLFKIVKQLNNQEPEEILFLFASSLFVFCPIIATGQYDILEIVFSLAGAFYYLRDKKLSWRVLLLFAIAISMKIFALFIFIILVLLHEKRVVIALVNIVASMLLSPIIMLPFAKEYYPMVREFNAGMSRYLFAYTIPSMSPGVSLFWSGFLAICIFAFLSRNATAEEVFRKWIWFGAAFWLNFFIFAASHAYWIIWVAPFFALLIAGQSDYKRINGLLLLFFEASFTITFADVASWILLQTGAFNNLIFKEYFINSGYPGKSFRTIVEHLAIDHVFTGVFAISFVTGIAILIINNPWKKVLKQDIDESFLISEGWIRIYRSAALVLYFLGTLICNIDAF